MTASSAPNTGSQPPGRSADAGPGLSVTQIVASVLATITATVALSWLGVAGTVIGAALASVLTVVGNSVYARSIRRTRDRVVALRVGQRSGATTVSATPPTENPAEVAGGLAGLSVAPDSHAQVSASVGASPASPTRWSRLVARFGRTQMLVALTVVIFVTILAVVTAVELVAGKPLADAVRNQPASGTTVFGGGSGPGTSPNPRTSPSPNPTPSSTPTVSPSTSASPSPTQSAPSAASGSASPSSTPTRPQPATAPVTTPPVASPFASAS